jgi:hypothetical protein
MVPEKFKPWVDLLDAVNILAAEDVKKYLTLEKSGKLFDVPKYKYNDLNRNYSSAITYFKSTYFKELNDFDGCRIVEQLKQLYK